MGKNPVLSVNSVLLNSGPYTDSEFDSDIALQTLNESHILVIGAGGLGCEILKDLALSGFPKVSVIDMDTIELSNLNRQFLFRQKDVGKPKAIVAAKAVNERVSTCSITPYFKKIQDFDDSFYSQFTLIICGLDSVEARRWINSTVVSIAQRGQYIPIVDGGTEGFQGSSKLIIPTITACFECYMPLIPEKITYPLCTLASTPRLAEHCIEWAHQLEWSKIYNYPFDADCDADVEKMYQLSKKRADEFNIPGVTKSKTLGVVKNIIPAIASTNAIISAQCTLEAFKFITDSAPTLENMTFYNGQIGTVASTNIYAKDESCLVCGGNIREVTLEKWGSMADVFEFVQQQLSEKGLGFNYNGKDLYNEKWGILGGGENELREILKDGEVLMDIIGGIGGKLRLKSPNR
ncbi:NEDD8-activating protein [Martiniozyma asiatica (nom. inval.)]|nr:NEDD8-activating protein [Martiniozyma asiatica]